MAETDRLTGLPNRFVCMTKFDDLIAGGELFSLTFLDVDLFKNINDALGHNIGDEVLKAVASVLADFDGQCFFAARLGGDEFALIAHGDANRMGGDAIIGAVRRGSKSFGRTISISRPSRSPAAAPIFR